MFIGMFLIWTINIWPWLSTEGTVVLCHKARQFSKNWEMLHSNPDSSFIWEQQQKQKAEDPKTVGAASAETEQWTCLCICHSLHHSLMLTRPTFHSPTLWAWPLKASEFAAPVVSLSAVPGLQPVHSFSIIYVELSLAFANCGGWEVLTPHLPLRQESFAPWAATCLPSLCHPFSLQLHVSFKAKTWALARETISLSQNGMGEGVLHSVLLERGLEVPHKTWTGPFGDSSCVVLGLSTHRGTA